MDSGECPGVSRTARRTDPKATESPSPAGVKAYSAAARRPR